MKISILAILSFFISSTVFGATLSNPFKIKLHDYSTTNEKYGLRISQFCRIYKGNILEDMANQREMGEYKNCGNKFYDLSIGEDGIVNVPKLSTLKSLKKKNHNVYAEVFKINDNGTKTILNKEAVKIEIDDTNSEKDLSFYSGPALNLKPIYLVYYEMTIRDSKRKIITHHTESRQGKDREELGRRYVLVNGNMGEEPEFSVYLTGYESINHDSKFLFFYDTVVKDGNYSAISERLETYIRKNDL